MNEIETVAISEDQLAHNWVLLAAPFDLREVDFRATSTKDKDGKKIAQVAAYIDARVVQQRLDDVVGPHNWSFDWQPIAQKPDGTLTAVKGTLTIYGISKSDIGDSSSPTEPNKACVSDAFKRCAVHWGIGRYLYALPFMSAELTPGGYIPESDLSRLRGKLPRPTPPRTTREEKAS